MTSIFEIDPIEEADRLARLNNETNHFKKRAINDYGLEENEKDNEALWIDGVKFYARQDKRECQDCINGDYDVGVVPD
jgi:hypothetical protein